LSNCIYGTILLSAVLMFAAVVRRSVTIPKLVLNDALWFMALLVFIYIFFHANGKNLAPAGADMATHTYTARVIMYYDTYPKTHEPIVPINTFGFAPYGMSVIIAVVSSISHIPLYTSALIVTVLVYPLLAAAVCVFLLNYYPLLPTLLSVLYIFFYETNVLLYMFWGGNTTIMSIALLTIGVSFFIGSLQNKAWNILRGFVGAAMLAASFYTHQTPFVILLYVMAPLFFWALKKKEYQHLHKILFVVFVTFCMLVPFMMSYKSIGASEISHIVQWQRGSRFILPDNNVASIVLSTIKNITTWHSPVFVILTSISLAVALFKRATHGAIYTVAIVFLLLTVVNANYWFLPLSPILYPDRVLTIMIVPSVFFITYLFHSVLSESWALFFKSRIYRFVLVVLFLYVAWSSGAVVFKNIKWLNTDLNGNASVTKDDLMVFNWIEQNLSTNTVIANNYGDAGIWIPGIIGRRITHNDTNAHYISTISNKSQLKPSYIFIGSKPVYGIEYKKEDMKNNRKYRLMFNAGNAHIYKIL